MTVVQYTFRVLSAWLALFLLRTTEVTKVPFLATDPPLYLPCSGRVDRWAKVAGFPSLYSQLITAEFSTNYLMVRYPNIKIYATEVKYRFLLLTSVFLSTVIGFA